MTDSRKIVCDLTKETIQRFEKTTDLFMRFIAPFDKIPVQKTTTEINGLVKAIRSLKKYRGSPLSTNSLSTIPGIVRF